MGAEVLSQGRAAGDCDFDHPTPSIAEFRAEYSYTFTTPLCGETFAFKGQQ
jgi:hypothetical protein